MFGGLTQQEFITLLSGEEVAFLPSDISGGVLWLDAADASTITESSGSVSQWDDKFASGNDAAQGSGSLQPTTNSRTIGGLNAIDFDVEVLNIPDAANLTLNSGFSIFAVLQADAITANMNYLSKAPNSAANSNNAYRLRLDDVAAFPWALINDGSGLETFVATSGAFVQDVATVVTTTFTPSTSVAFRVDGVAAGTPSSSKTGIDDTTDTLNVGSNTANASNEVWDGLIGEIIVYERPLTAGEIAQVESYLTNKWGI